MKILILLFLIVSSIASAQVNDEVNEPKNAADDKTKIEEYNQACQVIDTLLVRKQFKVDCFSNYQHFGPTTKTNSTSNGQIRIAGYNLLHPGTSKALFKDYNLVAKIMNQYDVVSALELLGTVGHDEVNNQAVLDFLRSSPQLQQELKNLKAKTADKDKKKEIEMRFQKLLADTKTAYTLYRAPGYFKVLTALKNLDPSWSLLLSPRGDSALAGSVEELVGFYYRANKVNPAINPHCNEFKDNRAGPAYACIINLSSSFMGKNFTQSYARRPFMASFTSGNMKFSLMSNHVVFTFSGDEEASKNLMKNVFGVETPAELGNGVNASNFARFAEVKISLSFMNKYRNKYNDKNIMFVSDTNLQASIPFWEEILKSFPGGSRLIDEPTTLSPTRYNSDMQETNGVANSYDHFVLDKSAFPSCSNGEVYNYFKYSIESDIEKTYMIRGLQANNTLRLKSFTGFNEDVGVLVGGDVPPEDDTLPTKLDYPLTSAGQDRMNRIVTNFSNMLQRNLTVKKNEVVADDFLIQERIDGIKRRIFLNQLTNSFYYRFYQELLSDHFPVSITCKN